MLEELYVELAQLRLAGGATRRYRQVRRRIADLREQIIQLQDSPPVLSVTY